MKRWSEKADENIDKWGEQPPAELALALAEELAEVCDILLAHSDPGDGIPPVGEYDSRPGRGRSLLAEQRDLGYTIRDYLETYYEDENGDPVRDELRPKITGELREPERVSGEIDDLGALAVQLDRSVSEGARE